MRMSHAAFIPFAMYGVAAGSVFLGASLFHEFLGYNGPRSSFITVISLGVTLFYLVVGSLISTFYGFLYFSRSHLRKYHLKRKHGLDFSAFSRWTKHDFQKHLDQTFEKFQQEIGTQKGRILWADINHFEAPNLDVLSKWKSCVSIVVLTILLWVIHSPYLQTVLVLSHFFCVLFTLRYLRTSGISAAVASGQIFDIVQLYSPEKDSMIKSPLQTFFLTRMFVLTTIGMYSYFMRCNFGKADPFHNKVDFRVKNLKMRVDLYAVGYNGMVITHTFSPSLFVARPYCTSFTTPKYFPFHHEKFIDAIHSTFEHRRQGGLPKIAAIILLNLPNFPLNEYLIEHIVSFLHEPENVKPSLWIDAENKFEPIIGISPLQHHSNSKASKPVRPYIPRNAMHFN
jgi:hypothetical protein